MLSCASVPIVAADTPRYFWAVVVGVNGGAATHLDNDAQDFANVLISKYGYPSDNIILLLNGEATKEAVLNALEWVGDQEQSPDGVSIFFSCHGGPDNIVLSDHVLWDYELSTIISDFNTHNILVVINACKSGSFIDVADAIETGILITACGADESTYDIPMVANTIFVEYFVDRAMSQGLADDSVQDCFNYAYANCADPPGALTATHPQMVDKYGEAYNLSNPVHAPLFTNLMAVITVIIFGYALKKKRMTLSRESPLFE